jgi:hypothetical protein
MDYGSLITVIASSAAALSVAKGIADWLRARRSTQLKITIQDKDGKRQDITLDSADPEVTRKVLEQVTKQAGQG